MNNIIKDYIIIIIINSPSSINEIQSPITFRSQSTIQNFKKIATKKKLRSESDSSDFRHNPKEKIPKTPGDYQTKTQERTGIIRGGEHGVYSVACEPASKPLMMMRFDLGSGPSENKETIFLRLKPTKIFYDLLPGTIPIGLLNR